MALPAPRRVERGYVDYVYRNARGHALKTKDGDKKSWDLEKCVKARFSDNDPVRANLEFFIGLRNKVKHRYQDALLVAAAGMAHAYVINYESELVTQFGADTRSRGNSGSPSSSSH